MPVGSQRCVHNAVSASEIRGLPKIDKGRQAFHNERNDLAGFVGRFCFAHVAGSRVSDSSPNQLTRSYGGPGASSCGECVGLSVSKS